MECTISRRVRRRSPYFATPPGLWGSPQFYAPGYCILGRNGKDGSETMAIREQNLTRSTFSGERDVEKRVYDALVAGSVVHHREMLLCRELAALAGSMYQRHSLSDADLEEMLVAVARE